MKRIFLFIATNVAVLVVISVVLRVLGVDSGARSQRQLARSDVAARLLRGRRLRGLADLAADVEVDREDVDRARVIETPRNSAESFLLSTVYRHADAAGIGRPEVAIYDSPDVNAFATGASRNHALVAVSSGLLTRLGQPEVEAVLGHEVTHVANGDMVTLALLQGVLNTFVVFLSRVVGFVVDRVFFRTERGYGPGFFIASLVAQILLGVLATVIVMWYSRQREFRADAGGAKLAGRESMIRALQGLQRIHEPAVLPKAVEAFGISGGVGSGLMRLFMSHPPLEERIAALQRAR